ncbi:MAG: CHAT domain-containing protein [Alkalinema sp. RU_4_3]|nr:CHAT domain-containing protein [Alkalinema sp. RU_4_3]
MESFLKYCCAASVGLVFGLVTPALAEDGLIQQASQLYAAGQFSQAKGVWQRAAESGDSVSRAVALGNLALTLQQLGEWEGSDGAITQGLGLIKQPTATYAQLLDIQGHLDFGRGRFQPALDRWQQAETIYTREKDGEGVRINRLNQAQAMQMLGLFGQSEKLLELLQADAQQQTNPLLKVRELRSVMEISAKLGRYDRLDQAEAVVAGLDADFAKLSGPQQQQEKAAMLLSLGHVNRSLAERDRETSRTETPLPNPRQPKYLCKSYAGADQTIAKEALAQYQKASQLQSDGAIALQSNLSQLSLAQELGIDSPQLLSQIEAQLKGLPPSRSTVFAKINLAQSLLCSSQTSDKAIAQHLASAINQAQRIQDKRAESYALGTMAKLYERQVNFIQDSSTAKTQLNYAKELSEKALVIANSIDAMDISYQWQWQLGRILRNLGGEANRKQAIEVYYPQAVKSLERVRGELTGTNPDVQFSFREDAEPVYREFVDLLLDDPSPSPARLNQAIELMDSLQVAELENFFRCVLSQLVQVSQVSQKQDPEAAIFYPIILPDRIEVILQLPNQNPIRYSQKIPNAGQEVERTTLALRDALVNDVSYASEYRQPGEKIYRWLIQAAEPELEKAKVKTLVFVLDGELRNVPIAALWSGKAFVIQKYAVAVTPGLKLLGPKRFEQQGFKALIGGLTGSDQTRIGVAPEERRSKTSVSRQEFGPLPFVKREIEKLQAVIPQSTVLVDRQFVPENLAKSLKQESFPIVHLATHGIFSNNPKETYLVTADNQYIDLDRLQDLLRQGKGNRREALELLTLSACETAKGNRRATLGMAGVAIRAGASSTVATLWSVDDRSTGKLVEQFYSNLRESIGKPGGETRIQALRQAQLTLLENRLNWGKDERSGGDYSHPYYWAPFIMLGNWL